MIRAPITTAVLFDLDGTLLDTAPDMVATLDELLREHSRDPLPFELARSHVSNGSLGLLRLAFGELPDAERRRLQLRFFDLYDQRLAATTRLFEGMAETLAAIEAAAIPWGVVTNKPARFTEPLLERLELRERCACVISGDTVSERKPHPMPLLRALELISADASSAVYVGDAARDIVAGRAAGMRTVAALYGYIPADDLPAAWGADHDIRRPVELLDVLEIGLGLPGRTAT
jgi:phosphoglycolate phosphatase